MRSGNSVIAINVGEALMKVVSAYPTVHTVLLELVQNGIDVDATHMQITVNQKMRSATVTDNGNGISIHGFDNALASVCHSSKTPDRMGKFGIGMISPLGKCERFTFTSKPKDERAPFITWNFVTDDIRSESEKPNVPYMVRTDLCQGARFKKKDQTSVQWSTEVHMKRISTDRIVSEVHIEKLAQAIMERFGIPMCKRSVKIDITVIDKNGRIETRSVAAKDFEGKPLPEWTYHDEDSDSTTTIRLYMSRKTVKGRKGVVHVREDGDEYRFGFQMFSRSVTEYLDAEVISAITSGIFEGEIVTQAKLHVNRQEFNKDTALFGLCCAIDIWYREVGKKYLKDVRESKEEERYQELGLRSMRVIEGLLHSPDFSNLLGVLKTFKKGTVGEGHANVPASKKMSKQKDKSIALDGRTRNGNDGGQEGDRVPAEAEKKDHHPLSVMGPHGRHRTTVRSSSLGIQFAHVHMSNWSKIYQFDETQGILYFNIDNILWSQCEDSDRILMKFQEYVAIQALTLLTFPFEYRDAVNLGYEELIRVYVFTLLNADKLAGRLPGRKSAR